MSELTQCNYCSLQQIKANKPKGHMVSIIGDAEWGMGGVNVYVHPSSINIRTLDGGEDGPRKQYRKAWFMELPGRCCC